MSPRTVTDELLRDAPLLRTGDPVERSARTLVETDLPALPVVDDDDRFCGIFGEREFLEAVFPGWLKDLKFAGAVKRSLDSALERREACRMEPTGRYMNTEHIDVGTDFSDLQVAEIFLHHRVLLIPVTEDRRVVGVLTRGDFFRSVADRFLTR